MARRVIISGGGTGGHIFPAIAIANALRRADPSIEILFVGALGRMEMEKVPAAGYRILGLDIQGINRQSMIKNITLPFKMAKSLWAARGIIRSFDAQVAVGVGGYASGPLLMMANLLKVPTVIQEQNSYAGITNKRLGAKAQKVCVAFAGMERFFPADKVMLTGNPIRRDAVAIADKQAEGRAFFGLDKHLKTVLVLGGSLGAKTLNDAILAKVQDFADQQVQVIWQCGSYYIASLQQTLGDTLPSTVKLMPFIQRMDYAYAAADLIVSRAGAGTISELCVVGKPVILVPSPNVAEDHQTKNAQALVAQQAAIMVSDTGARVHLVDTIFATLKDSGRALELGEKIQLLARLDADEVIAQEILKLID